MSMTDAFLRMMDNLRIRLPGALDSAIRLELFNTVQEFLGETSIWKEEIEFTTVEDQVEYLLISTGVSRIENLIGVVNSTDTPIGAAMDEPGTLVLDTEPISGETLTATVVLNVEDPTDGDELPELPDWIVKKYRAVFEDGTIGRMMSQVAKPYSSERLAIYHLRRFQAGMSMARTDVARRQTQRAQVWRYPRGFV
jgi:hypothetical protein